MSETAPTPIPPTPATAVSRVADPAPLGLASFASTTFVLSCFNANLIDADLENVVLPLALFLGGLTQLLAGMWEFRRENTFGATAFSSYGAFWLSYAAYVKFVAGGLNPDTANQATGLYLLIWAVFTTYMAVAALRVSVAVLGVFVTLAATYIVLTIAEFATQDTVTKVGGWVGLVTAVLAWYASFAGVTNATWKRSVIPTWPLA